MSTVTATLTIPIIRIEAFTPPGPLASAETPMASLPPCTVTYGTPTGTSVTMPTGALPLGPTGGTTWWWEWFPAARPAEHEIYTGKAYTLPAIRKNTLKLADIAPEKKPTVDVVFKINCQLVQQDGTPCRVQFREDSKPLLPGTQGGSPGSSTSPIGQPTLGTADSTLTIPDVIKGEGLKADFYFVIWTDAGCYRSDDPTIYNPKDN